MTIMLMGEESLRIQSTPGQLTIEAASHDQSYSPFHMLGSALGSALGTCTFTVLQSWAANKKNIPVDDHKVDFSWTFVEGEHRIGTMKVVLDWPSLAAEMWPRAIRVARVCGVHKTLTHSPEISVEAVGVESPAIEATL